VQCGGEVAMAQKPDGKAIRTERVAFTKPAAERIARVVRHVESGARDSSPLSFAASIAGGSGSAVKFAAYTATSSWPVVSFTASTVGTNAMTIRFLGNTAATAVCLNHLAWIPRLGTVSTACVRTILVTRESGAWRLIGAQA
jgi:hypothetical protein